MVRITKKYVREQKSALVYRIKELEKMSSEQLDAEITRIFPGVTITGTNGQKMGFLIRDAIDQGFPDFHLR